MIVMTAGIQAGKKGGAWGGEVCSPGGVLAPVEVLLLVCRRLVSKGGGGEGGGGVGSPGGVFAPVGVLVLVWRGVVGRGGGGERVFSTSLCCCTRSSCATDIELGDWLSSCHSGSHQLLQGSVHVRQQPGTASVSNCLATAHDWPVPGTASVQTAFRQLMSLKTGRTRTSHQVHRGRDSCTHMASSPCHVASPHHKQSDQWFQTSLQLAW